MTISVERSKSADGAARLDAAPSRPVVHVVNRLAPGGIETLVLELMRAAPGRAQVVSLEGDAASLLDAWPALRPHAGAISAFGRPAGLSPRLPFRLAAALRRSRAQAVVTHHIGPLIYGGLAARLAGVRRLVHVEHDAWHFTETPRHKRIMRGMLALLRPRCVAVSEAVAAELTSLRRGAPVEVIAQGVDTARFAPGDRAAARALIGEPAEGPLIGSIGRLEPVKGHDLLIDACAQLPAEVRCVIVGSGSCAAALQARIDAAGLADRVRLLGHRDDVDRMAPAFDLFCLPSRDEGLPRVVLEMQACGLPVVATDVGSVRDGLCPETRLLAPPADAAALAQAIARRLASPVDAVASRSFVLERFDFRETARRFDALTGAA